MSTYRLRFWYWFQEVVISGITADELIQSLFFPESCEMKDFIRNAELKGQGGPFPIEVTIHDMNHLSICHLKKDNLDSVDTDWGDDNGRTELDDQFWILEEEDENST